MGLGHSPRIVTDGLVLALDAGNTKSYPGSGSTWTDLSGNGNNGTLESGVGYTADNGGSLTFDGTDDHVTIPANSDFVFGSSTDFTIEAWIYITGYQTRNQIITSYPGPVAGNWIFWVIEGKLGFYLYGTGSPFNVTWKGSSSIPLNQWSYVTLTRIGNTWTVFFNGISDRTETTSRSMGNLNPLRIGNYAESTQYFDGNIPIVRIYKGKGLTPQEVQQNFNALRGRYGI